MRKGILILSLAAIGLTGCLKDYEDTSFVPQPAVISWSEESMAVTKDATTFEITLHSNLPWMAVSSASWISVTPDRGLGDAVLTVKVAKNRTVEARSAYLRVIVTADQFSDFPVTQAAAEGGDSNIYYVRADGDPEASGLSWANATTLPNAIDQASDGDAIYVAAGLYTPGNFLENTDGTDPRDKTFQLHSNFTLQGGFPANADDASFDPVADYDPSVNVTTLSGTMEDGKSAYHVLTATATKAEGKMIVLKGFTITGGKSATEESIVTVNASTFKRSHGAGLNVGASRMEISDCIITGNEAGLHAAGAIFNAKSEINMTDCRVVSNEAKNNCGGIWNCGGTLYMDRCSISDNIAGQQAAGYYSINSDGAPSVSRIYNCTISGNTNTATEGRSGGGAYIREWSDAVFVNCTFYGNKSGNGGGIQGYGANGKNSTLRLICCTITGNSATVLGGGISLWNNYNTTNIYNCIISGNQCVAGADIGYGSAITVTPNLFYETSIVGNSLYATTGSAVGGWSFDPASMLSEFGLWGGKTQTCTLIEGASNPACSQGMSKEELVALGGSLSPAVEASVFDTDQRGVARNQNTIGSITL
ncbi:MAG: hypothetical protein J5764_06750 [Bacteroidales bacterium]|nr:hypothetical protein [Bacteroidales bacterium]